MQNTFSQSGNGFKLFSKKSFLGIGMWNSRPPPFMEKTILNFHFDFLNIPLTWLYYMIYYMISMKVTIIISRMIGLSPVSPALTWHTWPTLNALVCALPIRMMTPAVRFHSVPFIVIVWNVS